MNELEKHNIITIKKPLLIKINEVETLFKKALEHYKLQYFNYYKPIIEWLKNNNNQSLLIAGNVGTGKTIMARYVIPYCLLSIRKVVTYADATSLENYKELKNKKILIIDDIGVENIINDYGNLIDAVSYLIDAAEKNGNLIILTTNLDKNALTNRYGERFMDRLELFKKIVFLGKSLRKK